MQHTASKITRFHICFSFVKMMTMLMIVSPAGSSPIHFDISDLLFVVFCNGPKVSHESVQKIEYSDNQVAISLLEYCSLN